MYAKALAVGSKTNKQMFVGQTERRVQRDGVCWRRANLPRRRRPGGRGLCGPVDPKCDTGFKFKGNKCVAEKAPSCPPLTTYDPSTQECIVDKGPECPSGQVLRAGHLLAAVRSLHGFRVLSVSGAVPVHQANCRTGCALIGSCLLMV
jgi:hypothetical protein